MAEVCPVCEGHGAVPGGFYTPGTLQESETCRTCGGRGALDEAADVPTVGRDPLDLTYDP